MIDPRFANLLHRILALEKRLEKLADRVSVMEDTTISHENRLEDLEKEEDDKDD